MIQAPSDRLNEGLADESRCKPAGDGSDDDHRPLVDGAFLRACGQSAPLHTPPSTTAQQQRHGDTLRFVCQLIMSNQLPTLFPRASSTRVAHVIRFVRHAQVTEVIKLGQVGIGWRGSASTRRRARC